MTLRRSSRCLPASVSTLATRHHILTEVEEALWLARQHDRFARGGLERMYEKGHWLVPPALLCDTNDVRRAVDRMLDAQARLPPDMTRDAATLLSEIAHNVCEHSGAPGAVSVTWEPSGEDAGLCLTVIDGGKGLRARDLIAAGETVDGERGLGLRLARALIGRYRGAMHIRSGGVVVTLGAEPYAIVSDSPRRLARIPGVQISVRLRLGPRGIR